MSGPQEQPISDPLLAKSSFGSSLILSRSGSGKTTLLKEGVKALKKEQKNKKKFNLVTVNAKGSEYTKLNKKVHKFEIGSVQKAPSDSLIIVEDIITMSNKDEKAFRHVLSYEAHHKRQKIFAVTHHVYRTAIYTLLAFFDYVIFTSAHANAPLLRFVFNYFKIDDEQKDDWISQFKSQPQNFDTYYFFDCQKLTFNRVTGGASSLVSGKNIEILGVSGVPALPNSEIQAQVKRTLLQDRFDKFMAGQKIKNQASAVFSIIVHCLPLALVREHDLTLKFASRKKREGIRVSLVDYVTSLLTERKIVRPEFVYVHRYFRKTCCIPDVFVVNSILKKENNLL